MPANHTPEPETPENPDAEPSPSNRAERRARGKGAKQPPPKTKVQNAARGNPVPSRRQWALRRSG
jgi:hypothetical protein